MRGKKKIAWLLSLLMMFSVVLGGIPLMEASAQGADTTFTVNITNNTGFASGNLVWYRFNDIDGWTSVANGDVIDISGQNGITVKVERADKNEVALDFTGSTGFATTDFMGTTGETGQRFVLADGQSYVLNVIFNNNSGNCSSSNPNPPQDIQNPEEIAVRVSEGAELLDTYGDTYITVDGINASGGTVTVEQASTHVIGVLCAFGYSISQATINENAATLKEQDGGWYYYEVADAAEYDIRLSSGAQTYTIAWLNSGALGEDAKVEHGRVEIVPTEGITDMTENHEEGGHYAVDPGTKVTIKLIPDYGYQLKSTDLNGATVAAGAEISTFTFEMPNTNLHLAALFEKTDDQIDCTASDVVSNVSIANGGNAVASGNLKMTVEDNSAYQTDVSSAVTGTDDVTPVASVDIELDNIVSKGDGDYWTSSVTEFTDPISVGLELDAAELSDGETYSVVRNHNGTLTELDTDYDSATGTITFDTNQFSTYTIIKKTAVKVNALKPAISKQPVGKTYAYNDKAKALTVTAKASDGGTLSYQWYKNSKNSTSGAKAISGATKASYTPSTKTVGTAYYYCVIKNTNSKATGTKTAAVNSSIVKVTVKKAKNAITNVSSTYTRDIGSKSFTLKAKGQGSITYKSSNTKVVTVGKTSGKVSIKGFGKATITVTAAGNSKYYSGTKKITISVVPKKESISDLKSSKKKTLTVNWKKDSKATGYQMQYATNKNFSKAKTVAVKSYKTTGKTLTGLTGGKKYYVRVRAFKKVGKTTLYGSWSSVKTKTVKK